MKNQIKLNAIFLLLILGFNVHAQKSELKLKLEKGKEYYQNTKNNVAISQTINGQAMLINMDNDGITVFKVNDIEGDNYVMDVSFKELEVGLEMGPQIMTFSSKNEQKDPFSTILKALVNKSFTMIMNTHGRVIEVRGMDELWLLVEKETESIPAAQKTQIMGQLKQSYNTKQLTSNIEVLSAIYPKEVVKKKNVWEINTKMEGAYSADIKRSFVLEDLDKNQATIKGNSTIKTKPTSEYTIVNGMETRFDLEGTISSTFTLDVKTGWVISASIDQEIRGNSFIKVQGQEMTVPMEVKSFTKLSDKNIVE